MFTDPSAGPWIDYDQLDDNARYWDYDSFEVLASFYGPNSQSNTRLLRAGLNIPQNTEVLLPYMIRYVGSGSIRTVPAMINMQWVRRQDILLQFRRKIEMVYGVTNLLVADVHLIDDTIVNDTIIVPPGSIVEP